MDIEKNTNVNKDKEEEDDLIVEDLFEEKDTQVPEESQEPEEP